MRKGLSKDIKLAWAVPIPHPMTATASLVAYENTYEEIRTFRNGAKFASASNLRKLPPELLTIITDQVFDSARNESIDTYAPLFNCLIGNCTPEDHYSKDQLEALSDEALENFEYDLSGDGRNGQDEFDDAFEDYFHDCLINRKDLQDKHRSRIESFEFEFLEREWSKLPKAQALLEKTLGLKIHYDLVPEYLNKRNNIWSRDDEEDEKLLSAQVTAFLILPRLEQHMNRVLGPNLGAFSIQTMITASHLQPLSEAERAFFVQAIRVLKLEAMDFLSGKRDKDEPTGLHSGKDSPDKEEATDIHSRKDSSGKEQATDKWPALMLLGSGQLHSYPVYDE